MASENPRILFYIPEWRASSSGVLHSQVLTPAGLLMRNGFECLFVGVDTSDDTAEEASRRITEQYGIPAHVFGCYSDRFGVVAMYQTARIVSRRARDIIRNFRPTHVYNWAFVPAYIGRKIARRENAVYVYDIKGIRFEEISLTDGRGLRRQLCRAIELNEIRKADRLGCVSMNLKLWVEQQTGRTDAVVIPCCIDAERFAFDAEGRRQIRQQFSLSKDNRLLCYSGGLGRWQRIRDIIRLFSEVGALRPDFRFLFLTREGDGLKKIVREVGLPLERCFIHGCPHEQVPRYLSAADAGVILRHDNVVNNTASPIKIGEYLGCGLPIILTRGIGDFGERISRAGIGLMLDESGDTARQVIDFLDNLGVVKDKAVEFCRQHLVFAAYLDSYRELFRSR